VSSLTLSILLASMRVRSEDIVDAAWEAGLGVHALIWVSHLLPSYRSRNDSISQLVVRV